MGNSGKKRKKTLKSADKKKKKAIKQTRFVGLPLILLFAYVIVELSLAYLSCWKNP
jgi:hypothetical protein